MEDFREKISRDLRIEQFHFESDRDFNQRLLISVLSEWARTLINGNSINEIGKKKQYNNVDIMYLQNNLTKIAYAYLQCWEYNEDWLEFNSLTSEKEIASDIASSIIRELLETKNLAEISSRRIVDVPHSYVKFGDWCLVKGFSTEKDLYRIGTARWRDKLENVVVEKRIIDIRGDEYCEYINKNFPWRKINLSSQYLIFMPGKTGNYSKCWIPFKEELIRKLCIIKSADKFNTGYILLRREVDNLQGVPLDPGYISHNEIYRILYALNYSNGTPAKCKIQNLQDYIIVHLPGALPEYEQQLFLNASWPYRGYSDKYVRIIPSYLKDIVLNCLSFMGIRVVA